SRILPRRTYAFATLEQFEQDPASRLEYDLVRRYRGVDLAESITITEEETRRPAGSPIDRLRRPGSRGLEATVCVVEHVRSLQPVRAAEERHRLVRGHQFPQERLRTFDVLVLIRGRLEQRSEQLRRRPKNARRDDEKRRRDPPAQQRGHRRTNVGQAEA